MDTKDLKKENPIIDTFEKERTSVTSFTAIGVISLAIFSILNIAAGNLTAAYVEIILGIGALINLILVSKTKHIALGANILVFLLYLVLTFLLIDGGLNRTGIYWFFTFPALAFFLRGRVQGFIWITILALTSIFVAILDYYNFLVIPYSVDELRQLLASFIAVSGLIYFYRYANDKSEELIIKQNKDIAHAVSDLSNEVVIRKTSEEKLQSLVQDYEDKNDLLEKTKKAVINLLDDVEDEKTKSLLEKDKLNTILQSIGDGVFVVDKDKKIILINQAAASLAGVTIKEAIGKPYKEILDFHFEDTNDVNDRFIVDAFATGEIQSMSNHTVMIRHSGEKIAVSDSAAPLLDEDNEVSGVVVVFRDVSKEREVDKAKTEFVSLASHQLRTPLSAINWYSEMLLSGDAGKLNKDQQDFVKEIYEGNKRMIDLVNALLNTSRIDLGTFTIDPKPTDILEISDSVIKELQPQIDKKKIKFIKKYDEIEKILLDPQLTRIILQNLLSNAVKYTDENGKVSISIEKQEPDLVITVKDNGYGITESQKAKIFEKLFRADNVKAKNTEGTGLGLYIVKAILDESGGQVGFDSKENEGSTFRVKIPLTGMKSKQGTKSLGN